MQKYCNAVRILIIFGVSMAFGILILFTASLIFYICGSAYIETADIDTLIFPSIFAVIVGGVATTIRILYRNHKYKARRKQMSL